MRYVVNNSGIDTEDSYPYTAGGNGSCLYNNNFLCAI